MPETRYRPRRSMIFAPGNKPRMCLKALDTGADMVCIDLEDAVAPDDKDAARDGAVSIFRDYTPEAAGPGNPGSYQQPAFAGRPERTSRPWPICPARPPALCSPR